jgi:hypothetical protein
MMIDGQEVGAFSDAKQLIPSRCVGAEPDERAKCFAREWRLEAVMDAADKLAVYAEIRGTLDAIHETASALETELARHQIYCDHEALARAMERSRDLITKVASLESSLSDAANALSD